MAEAETTGVPKELINVALIERLATSIAQVLPGFDRDGFAARAGTGLDALALKARSAQIADALAAYLPEDFGAACEVLLAAMGPPDPGGGIYGTDGLRFLPCLDYVERHGLAEPTTALETLADMTLHFSAEFAVRPYILHHRELAWSYIEAWAADPDWRRRRLASEGSRPRLPWGMRLKPFIDDPAPVVRLLDGLHGDPHEATRRSVANNLNDIAKDHPDLAAKTARRWHAQGGEASAWTVKHGLRTLIKQGHPVALTLQGFAGGDNVHVEDLAIDPVTPSIGATATFGFALKSRETDVARLAIDYVLTRTLANGKTGTKTFKLAVADLASGDSRRFEKTHNFAQRTTRTYYPGPHAITIQVNGRALATVEFDLARPSSQ